MLDPDAREQWRQEYLRAGLKFASIMPRPDIEAWARSMSMIAEQFVDSRDGEPADGAYV